MPYDPDTAIGGARPQFPTTRHTLVAAASSGGPPAREALDAMIAVYWKPAYKHVRVRWNRGNEEAKDLVQGFFAALLEQNLLSAFDPAKGRLRTFLRGCLDHFVMKHDESAGRLKRGGGAEFASLDFDAAEREIAASTPSPKTSSSASGAAKSSAPPSPTSGASAPPAASRSTTASSSSTTWRSRIAPATPASPPNTAFR